VAPARLFESKGLLRAWMAMTPAGFVAVLAGWYTTEIGRQPYVVYGLLRTSQAATPIDAAACSLR
jgi:cytochrome d ubiquinol oxidase subunit I